MGPNLSDQATGPTSSAPSAPDLEEIERLKARIALLEAERDEYAQQNAELFVLQQVFSTINSTLDVDDILSMVLRGVVEALGFKRAILFDVDRDGLITRRLQCDNEGDVTTPFDPREYRSDSTLEDVARGDLQLAYGASDDADCPLNDAVGSYCIAPLVARDVIRGMLYADDPPSDEITENQLRVLLDFASQAAIAVENARLFEDARHLLEESQRMANTDPLTGIPNRRALTDMLERELATSERYDTQFAFVILDIDDLKKINDSGGHGLGDLALKRFAQVLKRNARKGDILARYAGDEFVIVMTQSDREQTTKGVERILAALRKNGLSSSIGVAMFPSDGSDAHSLFFSADEALYQAKVAGKNQYCFFQRKPALESGTA